EQVQAELKDEGIDPNPLIQRVREKLAHMKAQEAARFPARAAMPSQHPWRLVLAFAVLCLVLGTSLWLWRQSVADAREGSNPQPRSEGIEAKAKDAQAWRVWQVLQDSLKDIVPSANDKDAFLIQRRIIAMHYALRDYDAVIETATQALQSTKDRLVYRYRIAA